MFYRLKPDCKLVTGAARGALYNFDTGKVYSINKGAIEFLKACEKNAIEDLLAMDAPESKPQLAFLDKLTNMGCGSFFTMQREAVLPEPQLSEQKLEFLWLELTANCNNRCLHCYATSGPAINSDRVPHERWLSLITEARQAGANAIQLIGGEPLLYPQWRELVLQARAESYDFIEIFTNATLIDDDCINFFKEHKVNIATTIYADNATIHDTVTANKGSFDRTMAAIRKVLAANIPLRIASILMKANEAEAEKIMALCAELGVEVAPPDVVRPTGRGDDKDLLPENYAKDPIAPPFFTDYDTFCNVHHYNSCLAGKIAITATGDVIPCIFARNQVCGNILERPLADVLKDQPLNSCWHTTKNHVEKCKDCEYRYACSDCRPLAQGSDPEKRWLAASECPYNPATGKWNE